LLSTARSFPVIPRIEPSTSRPPTVLLLHGASLNARMWNPVRRHLDERIPAVAIDLPGHGIRRGEPYRLASAVAVVAAAARELAPARVVLVGDSLGAYTSMASASAIPAKQLAGLVLAGATYRFSGPALIPYILKGALLGIVARAVGDDRFVRKVMPKALGPKGFGLEPADAAALLDSGMSAIAFGQAVRALRGVDWIATLAAIEQPTLIVNGDRDGINVAQEPDFLRAAKRAVSKRFADCEHGVSLWRPVEFAVAVNEFVEQLQQNAGPYTRTTLS
jgi:pimeloyl-ACP methyl ester carboxylesterase